MLKAKGKYVIVCLIIIILIGVPIIIQMNVENFGDYVKSFIRVGKGGDWLQFWGSYLGTMVGSGIAIGGVYWQVQKSIKNEKELTFRLYRPFCIVTYNRKRNYGGLFLFKNRKEKLDYDFDGTLNDYDNDLPSPLLTINNISTYRMLAVKIRVKYSDDTIDNFCISEIDDKREINLITKILTENIHGSESDLKLKTVELYFTTEQREKMRLVFKIDEFSVKCDREKTKIENHDDNFSDEEYNLKNYEDSVGTLINNH